MAHIHLSIPEDVRQKIGQYRGRVNWSQVATAAFMKTIEEIEEKDRVVEQHLNKTVTTKDEAVPSTNGPGAIDTEPSRPD